MQKINLEGETEFQSARLSSNSEKHYLHFESCIYGNFNQEINCSDFGLDNGLVLHDYLGLCLEKWGFD